MSYNLTLPCGCLMFVACHPKTRIAHTRIIEKKDADCRVRRHYVGLRLYLWEILPDPAHRAQPAWTDTAEDIRWTA